MNQIIEIKAPEKKPTMNTFSKPRFGSWALLPMLVTSLLVVASGSVLAETHPTVGIVPPNARFQGKTYSEWAASFWQWMMALPLQGHPCVDDPSFNFSAGQSGPVWYQAAPPGVIRRKCTIPAGKALFLTI